MKMAKLDQEIRFSIENFKWAYLDLEDLEKLLEHHLQDIALNLYVYIFVKAIKAETSVLRDICNDLHRHRMTLWRAKDQLEKANLLTVTKDKKFLVWCIFPPSKCLNVTNMLHADEKESLNVTSVLHAEKTEGLNVTNMLPNSEPPNKDTPIAPIVDIPSISSIGYTCISNTKCISNTLTEKKEIPKLTDIPFKISTIDKTPDFPVEGKGLHVSAVWYWAFTRYSIHGIDQVFNKSLFTKMLIKYSHILKVLGKDDWPVHKEYIDWYLNSSDAFIQKECKYNFNYMASLECYNKSINNPQPKIIYTDEERKANPGIWVK